MNLPDQFLNWRMEDGRKVPCRPDGRKCDPHDPANHLTRAQAEAAPHGVAFALRADDPWFFLDLDKCRTESGWSDAATLIWQSFAGAWGEISQSGNGLHIMGYCNKSRLTDRRNKWDGWLEFYTQDRFIAFGSTGWSPIGGIETGQDWTDTLLKFVPQREFLGDLPDGRDPTYTGPEDDAELIQRALQSSSAANAFGDGVTFADLWEARSEPLARKFPAYDGKGGFDHSSADAALMSHLAFWTGKDMPRMDRLFRQSGLMRDKYEKRADYRRDTVQNAARLCKRVYDRPENPPQTTGDFFLTIPEMIEHFKGCVYIRDMHRVLVPDGALLKPEQFNATYGGHQFTILEEDTRKNTRKAFEALTECASHRFPMATRPVFKPNRPSGEIDEDGGVNIYVKPDIDVRPGDITPFTDFLQRLLPHAEDREIMISYMASMVQNPGVKFQWAPVLQGTEGNGKTLLASCLKYAVGERYTHEPRASQMGEKYNGFLEGNLLVIMEEVHMGGRREMLDDLKPFITNTHIEIRGMAQEKRMIRNVVNFILCTNHRDAVIKSRNDRRYAVFFTAQQSSEDIRRDGMHGDYFPKLYDWLRREGYAFVAHWLMNYQIDPHRDPAKLCHRAPQTTSTEDAINESMGRVEMDIIEAVERGRVGFQGNWISTWALDKWFAERRITLSPNKIGSILRDLGYVRVGRASKPLLPEGGERPTLWNKTGVGSTEDYIAAQGPRYVEQQRW